MLWAANELSATINSRFTFGLLRGHDSDATRLATGPMGGKVIFDPGMGVFVTPRGNAALTRRGRELPLREAHFPVTSARRAPLRRSTGGRRAAARSRAPR